jgi:hypothetical protein
MKQYTVSFTMHLDDELPDTMLYTPENLRAFVIGSFVGCLTQDEYIDDLVITEIQ